MIGEVHPGMVGVQVGIGAVPSASTIDLLTGLGLEVMANAISPKNINSSNKMRVTLFMGEDSPLTACNGQGPQPVRGRAQYIARGGHPEQA